MRAPIFFASHKVGLLVVARWPSHIERHHRRWFVPGGKCHLIQELRAQKKETLVPSVSSLWVCGYETLSIFFPTKVTRMGKQWRHCRAKKGQWSSDCAKTQTQVRDSHTHICPSEREQGIFNPQANRAACTKDFLFSEGTDAIFVSVIINAFIMPHGHRLSWLSISF